MAFKISIEGNLEQAINNYVERFSYKGSEFCKKLCEAGYLVVERNMSAIRGDADPTHYTGIEMRHFDTYSEAVLVLEGTDILFIEFGAGVYYNGPVGNSPHPKGTEFGYTIGGYGDGNGAKPTWTYYDGTGAYVRTHGVAASMPMYKASVEMKQKMLEIAKQVFG